MRDRSAERLEMVRAKLEARGIRDRRILDAFLAVPRELFIPARLSSSAYEDRALPIESGQTISQPFIVARMIEMLELDGHEKVLEVGAGSGYAAAILSHVAREVFTIERHESLARSARRRLYQLDIRNVVVACGDGTLGMSERAPFDAILVSAGGDRVPPALTEQLAVGGRLLIPVHAEADYQRLRLVRRIADDHFVERDYDEVCFVPLIGSQGWESEDQKRQTLADDAAAEAAPRRKWS
jgi:protein-L-isoaspartate(D-aspartate) O-methyltransferase